MKFKSCLAGLTAFILVFCMVGCGNEIGRNENIPVPETSSDITVSDNSSEVIDNTNEENESSAETDTVVFEQTNIKGRKISYKKYEKSYEAENGKIGGNAEKSTKRKDYKGKSYVENVKSADDWKCDIEVKTSQFYNVTLRVYNDKKSDGELMVDDIDSGDIYIEPSKKWKDIIVRNVYMEKGKHTLSFEFGSAVDLDKFTVTASDEISKLDYSLKDPALINKNADHHARAVYELLCKNFGKNTFLGQHDTVGTLAETNLINKTTGKYPAIRFGDMTMFTQKNSDIADDEIPNAEKWAEKGGIVGYMWHWTSPIGKEEYYSDKTDFDIKKAVTKEKIADKSYDEIKKLADKGKISDECLAVIEDIDTVSEKLSELQDKGIAVLWRPLHEASNGYFWWGKDKEAYKWLWKLMYERQTKYHKLNNLIWVWSAQNADWYVGDKYCDVLSVDVYDEGSKESQINSFLFLRSISKNKPLAMSECGNFPSVQNMADDKAMWSYIGQWGGNFIMNEEGKLSEKNNTASDLIVVYNNNLTVTLDKLPDMKKSAEDIKAKDSKNSESETK